MPIYEYACTACGERTEAKQSFDEPPLEDCPHCGGKLRKLYSPVGIVFKGSGFYATDSKGAKAKSSTSKGESRSESKSESKADAKKTDTTSSSTTKKETSTS